MLLIRYAIYNGTFPQVFADYTPTQTVTPPHNKCGMHPSFRSLSHCPRDRPGTEEPAPYYLPGFRGNDSENFLLPRPF
jgi:hypothetical protein